LSASFFRFDGAQRQACRFKQQGKREQIDHVGVDLEENVFDAKNEQDRAGADPRVENMRAK
jgi:hypothetical protein